MTGKNSINWKSYVSTPLRAYQARICSAALGNNSIVVLPTGSGKTLIATTLAAWHHSNNGGKTLFLVPTQMLVAQQAKAVQNNAPSLSVALYHGELSWPKSSYDVLVSTPEAFRLQMVGNPEAAFSRFALVVFDEVHHVSKQHPYRKLARLLELSKPKPAVLGLTATCTYAVELSQIESDMRKLCEALGISTLLSATSEELVRDGYHGATPNLEVHKPAETASNEMYDLFESSTLKADPKFMPHQSKEAFFDSIHKRTGDPLLLRLYALTQEVEKMVLVRYPAFKSPLEAKGKLGKVTSWSTYANNLPVPQNVVLLHLYEALRLMVVTLSSAMDLVLEYLYMTLQDHHLHCIGHLATDLKKILAEGGVTSVTSSKYTQRFVRLISVLEAQMAKFGPDFRGILFVQQRLTTHILKHFIDRISSLKGFRTACIYATAGEASPTYRVTPSESKMRVAQFSKGEVNLLISTAVAEEGMDVPAANCIIRFDPVHTPVSFVQGRGRARQEESNLVVMNERQDRTVQHLLAAEEAQKTLLHNNQGQDILNPLEMEAARQKRLQAQQSRERSAQDYLKKCTPETSAIQVVKTYCKKTEREVLEEIKQDKSKGWVARIAVVGVDGQRVEGEAAASSKQLAKETAFQRVLQKLTA